MQETILRQDAQSELHRYNTRPTLLLAYALHMYEIRMSGAICATDASLEKSSEGNSVEILCSNERFHLRLR